MTHIADLKRPKTFQFFRLVLPCQKSVGEAVCHVLVPTRELSTISISLFFSNKVYENQSKSLSLQHFSHQKKSTSLFAILAISLVCLVCPVPMMVYLVLLVYLVNKMLSKCYSKNKIFPFKPF